MTRTIEGFVSSVGNTTRRVLETPWLSAYDVMCFLSVAFFSVRNRMTTQSTALRVAGDETKSNTWNRIAGHDRGPTDVPRRRAVPARSGREETCLVRLGQRFSDASSRDDDDDDNDEKTNGQNAACTRGRVVVVVRNASRTSGDVCVTRHARFHFAIRFAHYMFAMITGCERTFILIKLFCLKDLAYSITMTMLSPRWELCDSFYGSLFSPADYPTKMKTNAC